MQSTSLDSETLARLELAFIRMRRLWDAPALRRRFVERIGAQIDPSMARTLHAVRQAEGDMTVSDAATWLCVDASTASRMVEAAVTAGFLERRRSEHDRRRSVVTLTGSGNQMLDRVRAARQELLAELTDDWSERDIELFTDLMGRLAGRVADMEDQS
ncbi:MAG: MarR family winged helix-turn-helix transcriptional regulator [Actinomycetota bacterium]|nr:MarR family winged helix-turn-helix transcriptional regulator [Actinomycetota bacterium]